MDLRLAGKRALVTGGSKGIGRAAATSLAAEGVDLLLVARDAARLGEAADAIRRHHQVGVATLAADLSRQAEVERVAAQASSVDILVNNAGAIPPGSLAHVDDATWRAAWDLKVFGFVSLCRALYPAMAARGGGVIVNIIGAAGERFPAEYIAGAAGNAALMAFTRALARAAPKDGMRVVAINPGATATDRLVMLQRERAQATLGDPERWRELTRSMAYGRPATPEEIGDAVAFLASPRSGYTNGTVLTIDGGL
ncbi:MAG: SDR family oxidoreductase [Acidisphaera sp.]|nr:SDR family oxidoreductase [Acidisphaera sp.]MBV9813685.1 SDR family oxidoreductase [Acetobacteraceae bacterium]